MSKSNLKMEEKQLLKTLEVLHIHSFMKSGQHCGGLSETMQRAGGMAQGIKALAV